MVDVDSAHNANDILVSKVTIGGMPLKWCSISLSDVMAKGKRLDASVYDVEAKQARKTINEGKYAARMVTGKNGMATSYTCGRFKRIWVEESNFPLYQPSAIVEIKPTPDGYISKKTKVDIERLRVHAGQVLLTCSGTIGKVSFVTRTLEKCIFSHDLLRIDCKEQNDAGYIYTYLKSKIGNKILLTNSYGAVITHIEPEHLSNIPIPDAPMKIKEKIHNLIARSYSLRDESNKLIDDATKLLIEELKLPPINGFNIKKFEENAQIETFSVKLSNLAGRADASYHIPVIDAIIKHLKEHAREITSIGDPKISKNVILPGRFKCVYVEEGYGRVFFGGKQLYELDPSNRKYLSIQKHSTRIKSELEITENTLLITRSGTIGKIALAPKHWEHWISSDHMIRVVPENNDIAGYLYVFLLSNYGHTLITRHTYGSVVDEIDDNHVRQIPIPLLKNSDIQKRINDFALEANQKRYEAYCLEKEALTIMDEEIIYAK